MNAVRVIRSPQELNRLVKPLKQQQKKNRIGFVPTMGFLHEGHLSLVRCAQRECDVVVVSIFVNPTQFSPHEDFKRYPRNLKKDSKLLSKEKVDFLFVPSVKSIYPNGSKKLLSPGPLANVLCGPKRPGHFAGVATVVKRLFDIVMPDIAYFGQKDYQQARIIQEMVKRFHLPIRVKIRPIVREKDGLAMSSRNVYLAQSERIRAKAISSVLQYVKQLVQEGELSSRIIERKAIHLLQSFVDKIDYLTIVDPRSLDKVQKLKGTILVAIACFVGRTRLIDNILIRI